MNKFLKKSSGQIPLEPVLIVFLVVIAALFLLLGPNILMLTGPVAVMDIVVKPEYFPVLSDNALMSLLEVTDVETGKSIQELLAIGVSQSSEIITINDKTVDLKKLIDEQMKFILPDKNYYLVVGPLEFGNINDPETKQISMTDIRLPNLVKKQVTLYIG